MNSRPQPPGAPRRREPGPLVSADQDTGWHQETQSKMVPKTNGKDSRSKTYLTHLYQMHSTSLANMEFSIRLLEKDGRFADMHPEHRTGGLLDYMVRSGHMQQAEVLPRETGAEDPLATLQQPQALPALYFLKCQSPASPQRGFHQKTGGHQVALGGMSNLPKLMKSRSAPAAVATVPLTLEHVIQTHPVLESKTVRRYWVNYVDEE